MVTVKYRTLDEEYVEWFRSKNVHTLNLSVCIVMLTNREGRTLRIQHQRWFFLYIFYVSELFYLPKNPKVAVLAINTAYCKMGEKFLFIFFLALDLMAPIRKKRKIIKQKWIQNEKWVNTLVYLSLKSFAHIKPFEDIIQYT